MHMFVRHVATVITISCAVTVTPTAASTPTTASTAATAFATTTATFASDDHFPLARFYSAYDESQGKEKSLDALHVLSVWSKALS